MTDDIAALRRRLERAEAMVEALQGGQVDAVVGKSGVALLKLREAEAALEASERFAKQVIDASLTGIYIHDLDTGINVFINPAYTRLTGYTLDDLNRMGAETFFNLFHPDDRPAVTAHLDALRRAENGENREATFRFRTEDGRWIWRHSRAAVFSRREHGAARRIIRNFQDITDWKRAERALKESEARFRDMSNGLPLIVWVHDAQGRLVFVNDTYCAFFGIDEEEAFGQKWKTLVHPEDGAGYTDAFLACVLEQRPFNAQARVMDGRGWWRWIESWARPRLSDEGRFLGMVGASADITDRKRIEAELETASRRKDEFLAMLGHELRNPLAAIGTALKAARREGKQSARHWTDEIVQRQIELLRRLVNDLLDVSRITRGKITLDKTPVNIGRRPRDAVRTLEQIDPAGSGRVTVSEPETPLYASADPVRLDQTLSNLLGNAVKYSPEGGEIRLSAEKQGDDVLVRCRDRGIGIPRDRIPDISGKNRPVGGEADPAPRRILISHGYQTVLVKSGEIGVQKAEDFRPDIVLCDLRLPGMDGVETVGKLREMDAVRSALMVALSADRLEDETDRLTAAGFDAAVTKPLDPKALDRLVAEHRPSLLS